jgi:hypothetical protein
MNCAHHDICSFNNFFFVYVHSVYVHDESMICLSKEHSVYGHDDHTVKINPLIMDLSVLILFYPQSLEIGLFGIAYNGFKQCL